MRMIQVPKSKPILAWRAWLIKETMVNQFTTKKMLTSTNFQRHRWQKFKKADRAPQLNSDELKLLFFNCLSPIGYDKFKPLVEEFTILESVVDDEVINDRTRALYAPSAFTR